MAGRRGSSGAYTVSGPGEDGTAPSLGVAVSRALTFATRHRNDEGELTYYIRDIAGKAFGGATKHMDGTITVACAETL